MSAPIDEKRLADLRHAAEVAMRMSALGPHTVQVKPEELALVLEELVALRQQKLRDAQEIARLDLKLAEMRAARAELEATCVH